LIERMIFLRDNCLTKLQLSYRLPNYCRFIEATAGNIQSVAAETDTS